MLANNMEITVIGDASPLIYFAKLDELTLLSTVLGPIAAPPSVIAETVDAGKRRHQPDAERIRQAIIDGAVAPLQLTKQESSLAQTLHQNTALGAGECEVIICASQRGFKALLHDKKARSMAMRYDVKTISVTDVLFLALLRRKISLRSFKESLHGLAIITGLSAATLLEQEVIADEIARQLQIKE
jgi:predicted nucleic acid-binding protein